MIRVGATFMKDSPGSTANLDILVSENTVDMPTVTYTLNKATGTFTPPPFSVADMAVELNDTTETIVVPGDRVNVAIKIKIPVDAVVQLDVSYVYQTAVVCCRVHVGSLVIMPKYQVILSQNSFHVIASCFIFQISLSLLCIFIFVSLFFPFLFLLFIDQYAGFSGRSDDTFRWWASLRYCPWVHVSPTEGRLAMWKQQADTDRFTVMRQTVDSFGSNCTCKLK